MYRIGLSSCAFDLEEPAFQSLQKTGIKDIEISLSIDDYPNLDFRKTRQLADAYDVNLWSLHLPFANAGVQDIASADEDLRRRSVALLGEYIRKGGDIGIDKFVVHPCGEPVSEEPAVRGAQMEQAKTSLDALAELAAAQGAVIAVEDLPRSCLGRTAEEVLELISANEKLRVCFDTNHLLIDDNLRFVQLLAGKIVTLHVSDYDFFNERHWLPGEGKVDWPALYDAIRRSGYDGVWMYEIGLNCPKTIYRDRSLTFEDFHRNAYEIFENRPLTVISRPKENLGMWE